jgi:hypothetical protein
MPLKFVPKRPITKEPRRAIQAILGGHLMPSQEELERMEYEALMKRGSDAERAALLSWTAGAVTAAVTLSWAISARNPGLTIPVIFAIAIGFYGMLRGRQQVRWIAGYIEEFYESDRGPQWFTRLHRLRGQSGYRTVGDWLTVTLANAGVILALLFAWRLADSASRGDLMAGIATGCGVLFGFHSISETLRMAQTDCAAMWSKVSGELKEAPRPGRVASW